MVQLQFQGLLAESRVASRLFGALLRRLWPVPILPGVVFGHGSSLHHRRNVRGDHPRKSAARNQCRSSLSAFSFTSRTVMARSHAASGCEWRLLGSVASQLPADSSRTLGRGQIMSCTPHTVSVSA